jgi:hypothetical protein
MPFTHCLQEALLKRSDLRTKLSDRFEQGLRDGVALARAGKFRRPNWHMIVVMLVCSDSLFIASGAMGALMRDPIRNYLFIAALVPGSIVIVLLHCNQLKLRS